MTDRIEQIKARRARITPAPWHSPGLGEVHSDHDNEVYARVYAEDDLRKGSDEPVVADGCTEHDAEFIANSPLDVDFLLAEIDRLKAEIQQNQEMLK